MREEEKMKQRKQEEEEKEKEEEDGKKKRGSRWCSEAHCIHYSMEQKVYCFEVSRALFARLSGNGRLGIV